MSNKHRKIVLHVTVRKDLYEKLVMYTMKKYGSPMRKLGLVLDEILEQFFSEEEKT